MTRFENVGVFIREKVWLENGLNQYEGEWQGIGGSEYRNRLWRVTTHMEATGGYVKEIGRLSGWTMGWQISNYCVLGGCLFSLSLCRMGFQDLLPCHPPSYWLRLFSSQTLSRINTPTFSNIVNLHIYPPMKMEETEFSETSAYKIQTPGNYQE
jgi:hypothetical protein